MFLVISGIDDKTFFDYLESITSMLGNLGIFAITAYGFWLTYFSKNIKITSIGESHSMFFGNSINCTIMNKTLSPLIINEIQAVCNNKSIVTIKRFKNESKVIEPFRACNITGDLYTVLDDEINIFGDVYFKLVMPDKTLFIRYKGKIKKRAPLEIVASSNRQFDGVTLSKDVKYVLIYWRKDQKEQYSIYITKDGFMNKRLNDCHMLPKEIVRNHKKIFEFFKNIFSDNWCFQFYTLD